jgi:hypothetical protein
VRVAEGTTVGVLVRVGVLPGIVGVRVAVAGGTKVQPVTASQTTINTQLLIRSIAFCDQPDDTCTAPYIPT